MSNACGCGEFVNTGVGCPIDVLVGSGIVIAKLFDDNGNKNKITVNSDPAVMAETVKGLINATDSTRATYYGEFNEFSYTPRELESTTTPTGDIIRNNDFTNASVEAIVYGDPTSLVGKLQKLVGNCGEYGFAIIDFTSLTIFGRKIEGDPDIYFRPLQSDSWFAKQNDTKDGSVKQSIMLSFQESRKATVFNYGVWALDELVVDEFKRVIDVTVADAGTSTTDLVINAKYVLGAVNSPEQYKSTSINNVFVNGTANTTFVSYDNVTGNLTYTFASPFSSSDVVSVQINGNGFFSPAISITIP